MGYFNNDKPEMKDVPEPIAKGMVAVMGSIGKLQKDGTNAEQKYRYSSVDAFYGAVGPLCAAAGIIIKPRKVGRAEHFEVQGKFGPRRMIRIFYTFVWIHASGATWIDLLDEREVEVQNTGAQAYGAAESYALKSYLKSFFQVQTGEEDADAQEKLETEQRKADVRTSLARIDTGIEHIAFDTGNGMQPTPINDLVGRAIEHAQTFESVIDLDAWWKGNETGRAALHASSKSQALSLKRSITKIRDAIVEPAPAAPTRNGASNGHDTQGGLI
jgi:ERF superfamily